MFCFVTIYIFIAHPSDTLRKFHSMGSLMKILVVGNTWYFIKGYFTEKEQ